MTSRHLSVFFAAVSLAAVGRSAKAVDGNMRQLEAAAATKPQTGAVEAAAEAAREPFETPINREIFTSPVAGKAKSPSALLKPSGDLVVGRSRRLSEPKNPLTGNGEPKKGSFFVSPKLLGGLLGGILCAVVGFFIGGPIGAAVGFAAGATGGWMVAH